MDNKAELMVAALQQRIGEIVSNYEVQIALLRAEITTLMNSQNQKDVEKAEYAEYLEEKLEAAINNQAE